MKNKLKGFNIRLDEVEEWISDLEYETMNLTQIEQKNEKRIFKSEDALRDFWDNIK